MYRSQDRYDFKVDFNERIAHTNDEASASNMNVVNIHNIEYKAIYKGAGHWTH